MIYKLAMKWYLTHYRSLCCRSSLYLVFDIVTLVFISPQGDKRTKKSQSCSSSESSGGDTEILDSSSTSSNHGDDNKSITEPDSNGKEENMESEQGMHYRRIASNSKVHFIHVLNHKKDMNFTYL